MVVTNQIEQIRQIRRQELEVTWGLVPTMGALHQGHLALVRQSRQDNDRTAASIYVNPTQFGPQEDLASYPRSLDNDIDLLRKEGVDLVFTPTDEIMYPAGFKTRVEVEDLTRLLEGRSRPSHFAGVTLIVAKLFNIFEPTRAYFGQKDAQQTIVIRRMVADLNFNLDVIVVPTVREPDGLAMSSRNEYLSPAERQAASLLYRALRETADAILQGETEGESLRQKMRRIVANEPLARLDYVSLADPETLHELDTVHFPALLSLAVYFGRTRLIDNLLLESGGQHGR